jgi:hypothetical protein
MPRKNTLAAVFVCLGLVVGSRTASAEVQLTMSAGRVSLSAKNATVGQILAEWARIGQTKIVNAERVPGGPMTLELTNVPEVEALEILLRSAGGYVLAPRQAGAANASRYDRILILPQSSVSSVPRVATVGPPPPPQPRPFAPPQPGQIAFQPPPANDSNADDPAERPVATPAIQNARPPVFNTFPQSAPQRIEQAAPPAPATSVTVPVGVSVPGMLVPVPQPAGQPGVAAPPQQQPR